MAFNFGSRDLGIDLGTANVLVYMRGKGIVIREPSVVAVRNDATREILAIGEEAKLMIGRTPGNIVAVRPLRDGVIADLDVTEAMIRYFIQKAIGRSGIFGSRARVVICVPCGVTEVERRAVEDATRQAGAREAILVEEPMASAIGAGLPVQDATGSMIVDIGGGTCEVAVLSLGGIVEACSIRVGGNRLDEAIMAYLRKERNIAIGERTAEELKIAVGSAFPMKRELVLEVRGRDMIAGLPRTIVVSSAEVYEALLEPVNAIVDAIKQTLEKTPPELAADIMHNGITISGGGALLNGLDVLISHETGIATYIAEDPLDCVVLGAGQIVEDSVVMHRLSNKFEGEV